MASAALRAFFFLNRVCIASAFLQRGGRDKEEDYFLTESDLSTWPTRDFGKYTFPSGWSLEPKARAAQHVETCGINSANMARTFAAVYDAELLQERLDAIEYLRPLHIDFPHMYTLGLSSQRGSTSITAVYKNFAK